MGNFGGDRRLYRLGADAGTRLNANSDKLDAHERRLTVIEGRMER